MFKRGLKPSSSENDTRRRTIFGDLPTLSRRSEQVPRKAPSIEQLPPRSSNSAGPSPLHQSEQADDNAQVSDDHGEDLQDSSDSQLRPSRTNQSQTSKSHRFSLLKFRHASDPQISTSYASSEAPPMPPIPPPTIITTSPTMGQLKIPPRQKIKANVMGRLQNLSSEDIVPDGQRLGVSKPALLRNRSSPDVHRSRRSAETPRKSHISFDVPRAASNLANMSHPPPAYGDESNSSLALPITRLSESSRSDGSSGDHGIYATTTTTHTIHTTTTFFRLPRRKKDKGPLFPLPPKVTPPPATPAGPQTPRASMTRQDSQSPGGLSSHVDASPTRKNSGLGDDLSQSIPSPTHSTVALTNAPHGTPGPGILRKDSTTSHRSGLSISSMPPPLLAPNRGRSNTLGSLNREKEIHHTPSGSLIPSGRTSTSTAGRKSFGDLFTLSHRLRQSSEPPDPKNGSPAGIPGTPGSASSKQNSFSIPRDSIVYPEKTEDDTPASYLDKLEEAVNRGLIASILCKFNDDFSRTCMRKYMRLFSYFGDSIDMAVRKMLMEVELPKETQQIDRLLQGFANRYCECNPGIFANTDEAYFVAFSILLLHSDTHNKNNKRKMQRSDYVKNTQDQVEVSHHILECFYDNVSYTPFIHFDDEVALNSHRLGAARSRKHVFKTPSSDALKGQIDPYALILDNKLEELRPPLRDVMNTEDVYSATGTAETLDADALYHAFFRSGVLQIVSARSRPDAFLNAATITNPAEAQAGVVDIKAAKVGLLWRKEAKKRKARSPWQEWGAILTSSQLYFFRDLAWIKSLMTQHQNHLKAGNEGHPVIYRPPLVDFKPDAMISMDDSVALLDASYKRHKNAFTFVKHGGFEEVFLANDESDLNDWIAKINYAATFRSVGIRMRGQTGLVFDASRKPVSRVNSGMSERTIPTSTGDVHIQSRKLDQHLVKEIVAYRRQLMQEKIEEANEKLDTAQKGLDKLVRNARHLQIQTPIQQRTREALLIAAATMSANLKWTRVELWRTKCHRDILKLDLEAEDKKNPQPISREPATPVTSPIRASTNTSQAALARLDSATSGSVLSPKSTRSDSVKANAVPAISSSAMSEPAQPTTSIIGKRLSLASLEQSAAANAASAELKEEFMTPQSSPFLNKDLSHKPSTLSSQSRSEAASISNVVSRLATPTKSSIDGGEEQILREAGLIGVDGPSPAITRPDTSESERDRAGAKSPETTPAEKSRVRRSLRGTLRDSHPLPHTNSQRSRKARDSASSVGMIEDSSYSSKDSTGLTRATGSFTVHGKKASVITFGQDWNVSSPEEQLKAKKEARESWKSAMGEDRSQSNARKSSIGTETLRDGSLRSIADSSAANLSEAPDDQDHVKDPASIPLPPDGDEEDDTITKGKEIAIGDRALDSPPRLFQSPPTMQPVNA